MKSLKKLLLGAAIVASSFQTILAQDKQIGNETVEQKQRRMAWWTNDRFGMFIHWGLYAGAARHEWVKRWERMNDAQYQPYYDQFNPDMYDPKTWAKQAKARSEEHTSELQSPCNLVCRLLLEKKKMR